MELQWILLIVSICLVAVIAWHSNREIWRNLFKKVKGILPHKHDDLSFLSDLQSDGALEKPPEIIAIHIKAENGQSFGGQQLLIYLNRVGLRFGNMNIFHYYHQGERGRDILFSLASAYEPGVFDIENMEQCDTPALTLFMQTDQVNNVRHVFESMINVAETLAEHLNAGLYDHAWKPFTDDHLEHYQRVIDAIEADKQLV